MLFYFALLSRSQTTVTHFNEFCPKIVKISSDFFNKLFLFYDSFCHFHHKIIFFAFYCTLQNPMHYNFWTKIVNFGHCASSCTVSNSKQNKKCVSPILSPFGMQHSGPLIWILSTNAPLIYSTSIICNTYTKNSNFFN